MIISPSQPSRGLHHVEVYVSDLDRSRHFWSWFLSEIGYDLFQAWPEGVSFKLDDHYLVLVQTPSQHLDPIYHRRQTGLNHLAFWAKDREQVDSMTRELRNRRVPILYEDRHPYAGGPDYYAVFFEDPDRIKVELVAP